MNDEIPEMDDEALNNISNTIDGREHPRIEFAYPVKFSVFCPELESITFNGYIKNMSMSGAGLECEDRYGRFKIEEIKNSRIRLEISVPQGNQLVLFSSARWVKRQTAVQGFYIYIGIEFKDIEDWQIEKIEGFMDLRNKDHKMMWNMWEDYLEQKTGKPNGS
jgi:hypothetical protein